MKNQTETKPITQIMALKSNDDLRDYLQAHPNINLSIMKEKNESTLLHFAAYKNELSKIKIYILHFEAYVKENQGRSRNEASFEIQLKAWINNQNNDGMTALHFAGLHGNVQMMQFLERYGANMLILTNQIENVLFMCADNNRLKAAIYLIEERKGKVQFDLNACNHIGDTILHKVAKNGYLNFTAYLLNLPKIDKDRTNNQGWTSLMYACEAGQKEVIKRMLLKGVNRHISNHDDKKPIDLARDAGKSDIQKILNDEFSNYDKCKICYNLKVVYQQQKSSNIHSVAFLIIYHLILLFSNLVVEVQFPNEDLFYVFYGLPVVLYFWTIIAFVSVRRKKEKYRNERLFELQLPICPECCSTSKPTDFHCFICQRCIYRYDHHCPWINNCVGVDNIGKFTLFLIAVILSSIQSALLCTLFYFDSLPDILKFNRLFSLDNQTINLIKKISLVIAILTFFAGGLVISLFIDQIKNICTNTTSFERLKNKNSSKKQTLLSSESSESNLVNINNEDDDSSQEGVGCSGLGNCRKMLCASIDDVNE